MTKPYDATLKHLVEAHPADWLAFLGLPIGKRIDAVDADLSSVTAAADKVLRVESPKPYLAHLEFQSGGDATLDRRMKGAWEMSWEEHSVTYQAIIERGVEQGRIKEARTAVLVVGRKRLGEPNQSVRARLDTIADPALLEMLLDRAVTASNWDELLADQGS